MLERLRSSPLAARSRSAIAAPMPTPRSTSVKQRDLLTKTLISFDGAGSCWPLHQFTPSSGSITEIVPSGLLQIGISAICCLRWSCALWRWASAGNVATSASMPAVIRTVLFIPLLTEVTP